MSGKDQSVEMLLHALRGVLSQLAKPSEVLKTILGQAVAQTGADRGLFVAVSRSGKLTYRVIDRFDRSQLQGEKGRFSRNVFARVLETGKPERLDSALEDSRYGAMSSVQEMQLASVLCMPIHVEGKIGALVHLENDASGHFTRQHERLMEPLLRVAGPVLATLQAGEGVLRERDELRESESRARQELEESREVLARDWSFSRFVGRSAVVRNLEESVQKAAATEFPVLLTGETGTGKSILARIMHHAGPRSKKALITVFCPSLEKGMVETELFGHKRGAFTGAVDDRPGKVPAAEGGTLFLDELGEIPLEIQPKLLRLLQEKVYERVGDPVERSADVRVIAATNRDLAEEIRKGRFRRDLFERLNFLPIRIPPLRERTADIPLLLDYCLKQFDAGRWIEVSDETAEFLVKLDFSWPGNVRHVEQLAARLAMDRPSEPVTPRDVHRLLDMTGVSDTEADDPAVQKAALELGLPALLALEEKKWLQEALNQHPELTRAELAAKLKISEGALYKKLKQFQLGGR